MRRYILLRIHLVILLFLVFTRASAQDLTSLRSETVRNLEGIRFADRFPGANATAQINAAFSDCGPYTGNAGNSCVVIAPSGMGCGEPYEPGDHILFLDYRNCAQSVGKRYNVSAAVSGNVRSKEFLQDNFNGAAINLRGKSSATDYILSYVDNPDATGNTVEALNATMAINSQTGNFTGALAAAEFATAATSTNGSPYSTASAYGVIAGGVNAGGNSSITNAYALYAKSCGNSGTGMITNCYVGLFEDPGSVATGKNLSVWAKGQSEFDKPAGFGTTPDSGAGVVVANSNLSGTNQWGGLFKPTVSGTGIDAAVAARPILASSVAVSELDGLRIVSPSIGSGASVNTWSGIFIDFAPPAANKFAIQQIDANSVNHFSGPIAMVETTAPGGASSEDRCYGDSASHAMKCSWNNGPFSQIATFADDLGSFAAGGRINPAQVTTSGAAGVRTTPALFSNLAACGVENEGTLQAVRDSTTNIWGTPITGGGANHVLAYCNGTSWTVAAR